MGDISVRPRNVNNGLRRDANYAKSDSLVIMENVNLM
jgi:hypothetical protein